MGKKLTQDDFIAKAIEVHSDTYDLSKVVYVSTHQKVTVGCKVHGEMAAQVEKALKGKYTTSPLSYEIEGFKTESTNTNFAEVVDFINCNGEDQWQSSTLSVPQ